MRLWHKDLLGVLPRQQLIAQWRECCCIARNIKVNRTPNHLLVNKIMDYPIGHFIRYGSTVCAKMNERGYKCDYEKFAKYLPVKCMIPSHDEMFENWHNDRYLKQCYYNLQEKYDCGGIPEDEWRKVVEECRQIYDL